MNRQERIKKAFDSRQHRLVVTLMLGTLLSATHVLGQPTIRFYPIRSAPLGSPPGTIGNPVTPEFNSDVGCRELRVLAGVEIDLDMQVFGWGAAPGEPSLGDVQASAASVVFGNGVGADLSPKGWPDSPTDGAYQADEGEGLLPPHRVQHIGDKRRQDRGPDAPGGPQDANTPTQAAAEPAADGRHHRHHSDRGGERHQEAVEEEEVP